ncbi:unnamed protein product [Sphenostylis stenocarpa]|uniref:Uncharacterized protein n=1 Tax=Sphenostylis stenocarpa TaxID=92480 RepID=A0AA86SR70_9FABA|nr:unnamed protein product [Sphenostylis stenocarpa]
MKRTNPFTQSHSDSLPLHLPGKTQHQMVETSKSGLGVISLEMKAPARFLSFSGKEHWNSALDTSIA